MRVSALKKTTRKQISTHPNRTSARCVIMLLILIPPSQHSQWPCKHHKSDGGDHLIRPTTPRKDWGTLSAPCVCLPINLSLHLRNSPPGPDPSRKTNNAPTV